MEIDGWIDLVFVFTLTEPLVKGDDKCFARIDILLYALIHLVRYFASPPWASFLVHL